MWVSGSSLLQGMFVSTSEFLGVLSVLAHFVCRLAGVLATCQIILKTPILRTDDPSSQHSGRASLKRSPIMATVHSTPTGTLLILECRPLADSLMADSACSLPA